MFYAHFVLAKKGPLARIWLAAHWDKKLTKAHVFETNIESSVEGILQPKVKMALRTSGHLLLGIVRIYSRKAKYLLADCNEAFIKIKMAFRPGVVDLPEENREAAVATITLPEVFHDFDTAITEMNNIDMDTPVTLNQSRAEDITLKEDYGSLSLMTDDGFGDMGFDDPEMARDATNIDEGFDHASLLLGDDKSKDRVDDLSSVSDKVNQPDIVTKVNVSLDAPLKDDGFGGAVGEGLLDGDTGGLFEPAGLFDDAPLGHVPLDSSSHDALTDRPEEPQKVPTPQPRIAESDDDDDMYDMGPASMGPPSCPSTPGSVPPPQQMNDVDAGGGGTGAGDGGGLPQPSVADGLPPQQEPVPDQTTLIQNDEETFALAPLDATVIQGIEKSKTKRKRKLIVDEVKNISGEEMKAQLSDTSDIITTLDLAPPTKRLMHWKETGGVEKLFALPGRPILSKALARLYQRHLTTRSVDNEEFGGEEDRMDLFEDEQPEQLREEPTHAGQQPWKRRREMIPEEEIPHIEASSISMQMEPPPSVPLPLETPPAVPLPMEPPPVIPMLMETPPAVPLLMETPPAVPLLMDTPPTVPLPMEPPLAMPIETSLPHVPVSQPVLQPLLEVPTEPLPPPPPTPAIPEQLPVISEVANMFSPAGEVPLLPIPSVEEQEPVKDHERQTETFSPPVAAVSEQQPEEKRLRLDAQQPQPEVNHRQQQQFFDDDDDYGAPASIGPPDEQMADETYEQFEERILNKRTVHMLHVIHHSLESGKEVYFRDLVRSNRRKQVAQKFYTFLVLKKQQAVELQQDEPYGELIITRGPKFSSVY